MQYDCIYTYIKPVAKSAKVKQQITNNNNLEYYGKIWLHGIMELVTMNDIIGINGSIKLLDLCKNIKRVKKSLFCRDATFKMERD